MASALKELLGCPAAEQESRGYLNTAAEIASQPRVWRETRDTVSGLFPALLDFCGDASRLLLTGAGSSYYAALSAVPLLRRRYRCAEAIPSTEILMDPDSSFPREEFVLVSFARSGNSPEGNAVFECAESLRSGLVKQLVITCNRNGELARLAASRGSRGFTVLLPEETNDKGLAMTASFTSLAIAGFALGYLRSPQAYGEAVEGLARGAETLLEDGSTMARTLASQGYRRVFFLGSRPYLGGVMEAHLKVQELSGGTVVAKAEDTLGFRHGYMAAVDAESLIVMALSQDRVRRLYEADLLAEIRQKGLGRKTVAIIGGMDEPRRAGMDEPRRTDMDEPRRTDMDAPRRTDMDEPRRADIVSLTDGVFDYGSDTSVPDDVLAPLVALTGQLLGLFVSLDAGLRPDNPSPAGIINRVVQGVRIHLRPS